MLVFKARPRKSPNLADDITPSQRRIMQLLARAVDRVQDSINLRELEDLIQHRSAQQVANRITVDPWIDIQQDLTEELLMEVIDAGRRVKLPKIQKATLTYRFDADRPEARAWAEKEAGNLIVEITEEQRAVVRGIVARSQSGEATVAQVARQVRGSIGLTERQAGWVENFRQRQIDAAINRGVPAERAADSVQGSVDRYHKRIHRYRSETIARTETIRASSEGRQEAWRQGLDEGFISPEAEKRWFVEFDGCDICMNNGILGWIPINEDFPTGEPPAHPNCRCDVLLRDEPVDEFTTMTDEELATAINDLIEQPMPAESRGAQESIAQGDERFREQGGRVSDVVRGESDEVQQALADLDLQEDLIGAEFAQSEGLQYTRFALNEPESIIAQSDEFGTVGALSYNVRTQAMLDDFEMEVFGGDHMHIEYLGSTGVVEGTGSALTRRALQEADRLGVNVYVEPATEGAEIFWRKMGFTDAELSEGWLMLGKEQLSEIVGGSASG